MPMTRTLVMAMLIAAGAANASAQTQPPPANVGFLNVSFGAQPGSHDVGTSQSFPLYGETATLTTAQENGSGAMFDITAGYKLRPSFGVAVGFSNFSNTTDCFAQVDLFRTEQRDCLPLHATIDERRSQHVYEIFNREWPNVFLFQTDKAEHGKRVQRVAQVVEHVIATAIDHAGFDDCVIESGIADDLFCFPFRLVIRRAAARPRAQKTH